MALDIVPFPSGIRSVKSLPRAREDLTNLIPINGGAVSAPGASSFATMGGVSRGSFKFKGVHYRIGGQELRRVNSDGTTQVIGAIIGTERVIAAVDHAAVALIVQGGAGYTFDGVTLTQITSSSFVACIDVDQINGTFVFIPADGSPAFFSEVGTPGTILSDSFFDAEAQPDFNTGIMRLSEETYICGEDSIELFRYTGPTTAPLVRVLNGQVPVGYYGGKVEYLSQLLFVGNDDGPKIMALSGNQVAPISTDVIDEILQGYTEDELKEAIGMRFKHQGQDCAVFRLPRHTLGFNGEWFYLASYFDSQTWRFNTCDFIYGKYIVGDADSSAVGELDTSKTQLGDFFQREVTTFFRAPRDTNFSGNYLEVETVSQGDAGSIGLRLSGDGVIYGKEGRRDLPGAGTYDHRVLFNYPGGLGDFESFMGIKIRTAEPVDFNADALWLDHG